MQILLSVLSSGQIRPFCPFSFLHYWYPIHIWPPYLIITSGLDETCVYDTGSYTRMYSHGNDCLLLDMYFVKATQYQPWNRILVWPLVFTRTHARTHARTHTHTHLSTHLSHLHLINAEVPQTAHCSSKCQLFIAEFLYRVLPISFHHFTDVLVSGYAEWMPKDSWHLTHG